MGLLIHRPEPLQVLRRPIILKSGFPIAIGSRRGSANKRGAAVGKSTFGDVASLIPHPSVSLTTMSLRPLALSSAIRFDPMNPAPPVTSNIKLPRRRQGGPAFTAAIDGDCATQVAPRRQAGPSYARERV